MAIAWVGIQMPHKIAYNEEETSPRGVPGYRLTFEFKREVAGDIREKLPVPFLRHVMQQTINLEEEHGPDIGFSEYKIRRSRYRVDVKFMKYSGLPSIAAGHKDHQHEEVEGLFLSENSTSTECKK